MIITSDRAAQIAEYQALKALLAAVPGPYTLTASRGADRFFVTIASPSELYPVSAATATAMVAQGHAARRVLEAAGYGFTWSSTGRLSVSFYVTPAA